MDTAYLMNRIRASHTIQCGGSQVEVVDEEN